MALIVEDGTGKIDAQTYATAAQLVTYAAARTLTIPATTPEQESLLLKAMDYLESLRYIGSRYTQEQSLSWPRTDAYVDGWLQTYTVIPARLVQAQLQLAIDSITVNLLPNIAPGTKGAVVEETVGAITVKYAAPSEGEPATTIAGNVLGVASALLRPLLRVYGQARVSRG